MLARALAFAAKVHQPQRDKQGVPYVFHVFRVAEALRRDGWSETHQTAGVLHDTVEDTNTTLEEIHEQFGSLVGDAVDALSRRGHWEFKKWIPDEDYKDYIPRCCENAIARVVKRYDIYDNSDPRRYCKGSPIGRYVWALDYINELEANLFRPKTTEE